jgi:hypothetical protein
MTSNAAENNLSEILQTIFVTDAHRGDRKRFVVRADEIPTAFIELESVIRNHVNNSAF